MIFPLVVERAASPTLAQADALAHASRRHCQRRDQRGFTAIDPEQHRVTVHTDDEEDIDYAVAELGELAHAYALTVHRAQGSEYPAVVIPLITSAWIMLRRNLLYTAVTRAKSLVVLIGSTQAIDQAVRVQAAGRNTALNHRLADG